MDRLHLELVVEGGDTIYLLFWVCKPQEFGIREACFNLLEIAGGRRDEVARYSGQP